VKRGTYVMGIGIETKDMSLTAAFFRSCIVGCERGENIWKILSRVRYVRVGGREVWYLT
jgi:hypothetical protein